MWSDQIVISTSIFKLGTCCVDGSRTSRKSPRTKSILSASLTTCNPSCITSRLTLELSQNMCIQTVMISMHSLNKRRILDCLRILWSVHATRKNRDGHVIWRIIIKLSGIGLWTYITNITIEQVVHTFIQLCRRLMYVNLSLTITFSLYRRLRVFVCLLC